jgi:hypothetical protein
MVVLADTNLGRMPALDPNGLRFSVSYCTPPLKGKRNGLDLLLQSRDQVITYRL